MNLFFANPSYGFIMNRIFLTLLLPVVALLSGVVTARGARRDSLPVVHPPAGTSVIFGDSVEVRLAGKLRNYLSTEKYEHDPDIYSPKSINIHPSGKKFYVNSLEGARTVVYTLPDLRKKTVIRHKFTEADSALWTPPSGLFKFRHYSERTGTFTGKPVESAFSHGGRYLWVPYYRRSFDLNAQDPSAVAIIDTETDRIVRMMEAGVLPKMIARSPDGALMAVTHWGDNTVGLIDISSDRPADWKYVANIAVGRQLFHDFSLTEPVDRDSNTGEALRGTVFTPDGRYLLIGCMGGGGIAVIDAAARRYLGKLLGTRPNLRHLTIRNGWLYASINASGHVERVPLATVMRAVGGMDGSGNVTLKGVESCKVGGGARTLELSPRGDYIFVACNTDNSLCVVDSTMKLVAKIPADSYPVGLDISPDGKWIMTTSQGRKGFGGNCVDIFSVTGLQSDFKYEEPAERKDSVNKSASDISGRGVSGNTPRSPDGEADGSSLTPLLWVGGATLLAAGAILLIARRRRVRKEDSAGNSLIL